jgi:hypothetical protein
LSQPSQVPRRHRRVPRRRCSLSTPGCCASEAACNHPRPHTHPKLAHAGLRRAPGSHCRAAHRCRSTK